MRLAALMKVPTVFVMTHDSIGLGEDGPTHQPVEHLAISRATPNTMVFRPCDTVETAEAWELALSAKTTPSVLSLTRQGLSTVRVEHKNKNLTAQGAYVLAEAQGKRDAILIATGSEVEIALKARDLLQAEGIGTRVVSMPCMELFAEQDEAYRKRVLPGGASPRGRRGRCATGLGPLASGRARPRGQGRVCRYVELWRLRPRWHTLREIRHHRRSGG